MGPIDPTCQLKKHWPLPVLSSADAIHPGYGLLSESPEFVDACEGAGILFIEPSAETMRSLSNKVKLGCR